MNGDESEDGAAGDGAEKGEERRTVGSPFARKLRNSRDADTLPVVATKTYDLVRWLHERSARFPQQYRFGLADRVQRESLTLLSTLVDATYSKRPHAALRSAAHTQARLRVLVRLSRDLGCLSTKQYLYAIEPLEAVGKMIGGWTRYAGADSQPESAS